MSVQRTASLDRSAPPAGRVGRGHPIDVASGAQYTAWHDLELPGLLPLVFRRFYSTALLSEAASILGPGWVIPFEATLTRDHDGYVLRAHDGDIIPFDDPYGILEQPGRSLLNPTYFMTLTRRDDSLEVTHWHPGEAEVQRMLFRPKGLGESSRLRALEDLGGRRIECVRNKAGQLLMLRQHAEHRQVHLNYRTDGLLESLHVAGVNEEPTLWSRYEYDRSGRLVAVFDRTGAALRYAYDAQHRLTEETDRAGGKFSLEYDGKGRCISSKGQEGYQAVSLHFEPLQHLTTVTDGLGRITRYVLNSQGQVTCEISPLGDKQTTTYDEWGRIIAQQDSLGRTSRQIYDAQGNKVTVVGPDGAQTRYEFNDAHQVVAQIDAAGFRSTWKYDSKGDLIEHIDASGASWYYSRDHLGRVISATAPSHPSIHFQYDPDHRWLETRDGETLTRIELDGLGRTIGVHDALGLIRRMRYDGAGNLLEVEEADGALRRFEHRADGNLTRYRDARGAQRSFRYSHYGDLLEIIDPLRFKIRLEYDCMGQLTKLVNEKKEEARFEYDLAGRLTEQTHFDGRVERYTRDSAGQVTEYLCTGGPRIRFLYDDAGRLIERRHPRGVRAQYRYDVRGALLEAKTTDTQVSFERDALGRVIAEEQQGGERRQRLEYQYDLGGNLIQRHWSQGDAGPLTLQRDDRGRLTALISRGEVVQRFAYDPLDRLTQRSLGTSGVERLSYSLRGSLASQQVEISGATQAQTLLERTYAYDPEKALIGVTDSERGNLELSYNDQGRLSQVTRQTGQEVSREQLLYDGTGNLVRGSGMAWEIGQGDRLLARGNTRFELDSRGRRILSHSEDTPPTRYVYNDDDQLVEITDGHGNSTFYHYDALGRRLWKEKAGVKSHFAWAGNELAGVEDSGGRTEWFLAGFAPLACFRRGQWSHLVVGHRGETLLQMSPQGAVEWWGDYDLFGLKRSEGSISMPWRLLGQFADEESGLCYSRFRHFDPETGRFTSPDPLGLAAGLNEYTYGPDPLNYSDPWGLYCGGDGINDSRPRILADNNLLDAAQKGHPAALAEIHKAQVFITPNQLSEFMNVNTSVQRQSRREFLESQGIRVLCAENAQKWAESEAFQQTFHIVAPSHGRGDAALAAFARASGYEALTMEKKLVNFLTYTRRERNLLIRRL